MSEDRKEIVRGFRLKGLGITTYCRVKAMQRTINLSFGTRSRHFCVIFVYNDEKPTEIYLDSVESDKECAVGGRLADIKKGAVRFVKLALYAVKRWFPQVTMIRFHDDSKIRCPNSNVAMLLPLDYIAKYGKTWYEYHFHAQIDTDMGYKNTEGYYRSLEILTRPCEDYDIAVERVPSIALYEAQYRASATPRDFMEKVRAHLGDKYCEKGARLLTSYMKYLYVDHIPRWRIRMEDVETVPDFERGEISPTNAKQRLNGGTRRRRTARFQFTHEPDQLWHPATE